MQFDLASYSVNEMAGAAPVRVDRLGGDDAVTVDYATSDGSSNTTTVSAVAGTNYLTAAGTLSWAAGDQTPKFISMPFIGRDVNDHSLHTLTLTRSNPTGGVVLGPVASAQLTINDRVAASVINSATTVSATDLVPLSYQITATNNPTYLYAQGLPQNLTINQNTGLVTGIPKQLGTSSVTISATNQYDGSSSTLNLTITANPPVVSSPASASGTAGSAFSYQIADSPAPGSFGATNLPAGLSVNPNTGVISGAPATAGTFNVMISASNNDGTGTASLSLKIGLGLPMVTSATTASATAGAAFTYEITATNSPTSYGASGLPSGLSVNQTTGVISGTPADSAAGTKTITLKVANATGTATATLTLAINPSAPVITSADASTATIGVTFSYQIKATSKPTGYNATGLPSGLSVNKTTGVISGTPASTAAGVKTLNLSAINSAGTGTATLTLTINPPAPVITSATTASATVGKAFSYQIKATNQPTSYNATGMLAGLSVDKTSGLVSGSPNSAGTKTIDLSATNATGTGTETLTLTVSK